MVDLSSPPDTSASKDGASPPVIPDGAMAPATHSRCGWIGAGEVAGENAFLQHLDWFRAIHPKWFTLQSDGVNIRSVGHTDLASVVNAAGSHGVRLSPLIDADDGARIRLLINDPQRRAAHIQNLVTLVTSHSYDGLDIDYEHLWKAADRAPFVAFMSELSVALHAIGRELSMALPSVAKDDGNSAYDYNALSAACDTLHVMGYDFHYLGGSHLGPLGPLGWVDQTFARAAATGRGNRFILGLANYAITSGSWTTARAAAQICGTGLLTQTDHMASCPYGDYSAGRAPHCAYAGSTLWFEDLASMEAKIIAALSHGARGVTYWTLGDEIDGFFPMVEKRVP